MTIPFDPNATLTDQEILIRFKRVFGRELTPEERYAFMLLPEPSAKQEPNPSNAVLGHYPRSIPFER